MKPIWIYWSKRQWVAVASAGPYASLHLAPARQPHKHPTAQFFTGRMPFLLPNQQRQSTESMLLKSVEFDDDWRHMLVSNIIYKRIQFLNILLNIGLLTFGSRGLDYTYIIHAFIHTRTYTENKIELLWCGCLGCRTCACDKSWKLVEISLTTLF